MTRQQFIAMLPVTLLLPDGGAGGTNTPGTTSQNGGVGSPAASGAFFSGTGTYLGIGTGGIVFTAFAGSGAPGTGGGVVGNGGGGGGLWGNGLGPGVLATNGGAPSGVNAGGGSSTAGQHDNYSCGGGFGIQNSGGAGAGADD